MRILARTVVVLLLLAPACSKKTSPEPEPTKPPTTSLANPASENCIAKGGKLEIVDTPEGQQGICTLADGTKCEEWAYMRGECPCGECPQYMPPAPGFCEGGTIVPSEPDACGCNHPPTCQMPDAEAAK